MSLTALLKLLFQVSQEAGSSHPLIVGGAPRDKVVGNLKQSFNDIDITTGDNTVFPLAKDFGIKLKKHLPIIMKQALDGHITVYLPDLKIDFSSNFNVPGIEKILYDKGIKNSNAMQKEIYSRDFFCNTLLMSLDFKKIRDLTGEALKDIDNKIIRTCLTPDLTFKFNTNRIVRSIYLSAKLNFDVSPDIITWVRDNPDYLLRSETAYLQKNIDKALSYDPDRVVYLLDKMELWDYIPITQALQPYYRNHSVKNFNV
jgi:tRNA nucleotidyltransferase/poly(A) polymerase